MKILLLSLLLIGTWTLRVHAWTAAVASPPVINGSHTSADYIVNFSSSDPLINGGIPSNRQESFKAVTSSSDLKGRCASFINSYLTIDGGLPTTNFVVDISTQPIIPLTQAQLDLNQWLTDYSNFRHYDGLFEPIALSTSGIFTSSADPFSYVIFLTLRKKVHDNLKPEYLPYLFP